MTATGLHPGLLLDRDGVINHDPGYLYRQEECRFMDGIFPLVRAFRHKGFRVAVTTNQAGIGRGLYTEADFETLMSWMRERFALEGAPIDAVYHCPFHPVGGIGHYLQDSPNRKPAPGMLLEAAADLDLDLSRSWTIGDKTTDIEAGRRAGVGTLVLHDRKSRDVTRVDDYWVVPDLHQVVELFSQNAGDR